MSNCVLLRLYFINLDKWKILLEKKENILALLIEFQMAFDLFDPELLFLKLFQYGFDNSSLALIMDYFLKEVE
jgi:hypothetical protein